jgi:hypothetical protein
LQGRYKAVLVDADSYLLELTRYVVLNPVRAGMVAAPGDWPWSSYRATVGADDPPAWLQAEALLAQFGDRRDSAVERYIAFVRAGVGAESIWRHLNRQVFLGDDGFVARVQAQGGARPDDLNIPRTQRRPPPLPLAAIAAAHDSRDAAIRAAWASGGYSYREIGDYFGVHQADRPGLALLKTAPGIGKVLGLTALLETGPIARFARVGDYASYCRMVDSVRLSNGKKKGQGNRKCGNRFLCWAYIEAAHYALRHESVRLWYQRKLAKSNLVKARKAVAHKIARGCYHVLRERTPFDMARAFG